MAKLKKFVFNPKKWNTPNSYDTNFMYPPKTSGVYLLVVPDFDPINKEYIYSIKYVGSAKNLKQRYDRHEVMRFLRNQEIYVQFYFIEVENYRDYEKSLIKSIQPQYNKQWR